MGHCIQSQLRMKSRGYPSILVAPWLHTLSSTLALTSA
jgi:hypothetical protein